MSAYENGGFTRGYDRFAEILADDQVKAVVEDAFQSGFFVEDKRGPLEKGPIFLEFAEGRATLPPTPELVADSTEGHRLYRRGVLKRIERIMLSSKPWDQVKKEINFELGETES